MEEQSQQTYSSLYTPSLKLKSKPSIFQQSKDNPNMLYIAQNNDLSILDIQKMKIMHQLKNVHDGRIGAIRSKDNLLMTAGYDSHVHIFDSRNLQKFHTFQRIPAKFNTIDKSQHILAAAYNNHIAFWDLKKMKQRSEFKDSFNDEITCLRFNEIQTTKFSCCSIQGLISMFDLTQPNEEDAFQWCFKIIQSPQKLSISRENILLVQTTDHVLLKISDGQLIDRKSINNIENPKHLINSKLISQQQYQYCCWLPQEQVLEVWNGEIKRDSEDKCKGYLNNIEDIQILHSYGNHNIIWGNEQGEIYKNKYADKKMIKKRMNSELPIMNNKNAKFDKDKAQQDLNIPTMNNNGYLLNKVSSFSKNKKKFNKYGNNSQNK